MFAGTSCQLTLLEVKFIPEIFLKFLLSTSLHLFGLKFLENLVTCLFSRIFGSLDLIQALLLLLSILTNHLVLKSFHLILTLDESALLIHGEDHVGLGLLHLEVLDAGHLAVFSDHTLDDVVDLLLLSQVFSLGLGFELFTLSDLLLNLGLVVDAVVEASGFSLSLDLVLNLLGPEHDLVDLGVLLLLKI